MKLIATPCGATHHDIQYPVTLLAEICPADWSNKINFCIQWSFLLTWFNFNPSTDK